MPMKANILLTSLFLLISTLEMAHAADPDGIHIARYKDNKTCAISYTFDDGLAEHYTLAAPQLEKRGFRGTFWIVGSKINQSNRQRKDTTHMTWPQLKKMAKKGHEISNHGWAHKSHTPKHTPAEIREDIQKNDSAILANVGIMPRTYCYPGNRKDPEGMKIAEEGRVGTRTHQRSIGSKANPQYLDKWLNALLASGEWGVGMTHGLNYGYDAFNDLQSFWDHLDKVEAMKDQVWVGTFREVAAYIKERDNTRLDIAQVKKRKIEITPHPDAGQRNLYRTPHPGDTERRRPEHQCQARREEPANLPAERLRHL